MPDLGFGRIRLNEEGQLVEHYSEFQEFPAYLRSDSFRVVKGRLYAVSYRLLKGKFDWSLEVFDGDKWELV